MAREENYLKARQSLGKYRIQRRLAESGFAVVYEALDTVEGIRVALKIPYERLTTEEMLDNFRKEVRLAAKLDHPNILSIKNASTIDGHFVIVLPLAEQTLADRLCYRMAFRTAIDFSEQILEAVAYAHQHRIIHCDIKPENVLLFPGNRIRLTDFGIAKVARRTIDASGSGTVGYVAPEQAMGRPSLRSDVFSVGLMLYRMFTGRLPEWPFRWPPPGHDRLRRRVHPDLIGLLRKSMEVKPSGRYENAEYMLSAFRRVKPRALKFATRRRKKTDTK